MSHEQSETIQLPSGKWVNVYGRKTPKSGQPLPNEPEYDSMEQAVEAAKARSAAYKPETIMLDAAKLTTLATQANPFPVIEMLSAQPQGTNFMTMPPPAGAATSPGQPSFQSIIGGAQGAMPPTAGINPQLAMLMMQMGQQKPQQAPMAPAAAPRPTPPVQFQPIAPMPAAGSMSRILGR